jgi:hypothetical protein
MSLRSLLKANFYSVTNLTLNLRLSHTNQGRAFFKEIFITSKLSMSLYYVDSSWQTPSKLIPKVTNNSNLEGKFLVSEFEFGGRFVISLDGDCQKAKVIPNFVLDQSFRRIEACAESFVELPGFALLFLGMYRFKYMYMDQILVQGLLLAEYSFHCLVTTIGILFKSNPQGFFNTRNWFW